jgi:hypothetical protein
MALFLCSCASMMSGNQQEITLTSTERDVDVYMNDEYLGKTPVTVSIDRQSGQFVEFQKSGFHSAKIDLKTKINPNFYWNLPLTVLGTTGMSTDFGSGAIYEFNSSKILVRMRPINQKSGEPFDMNEFIALVGESFIEKEKARGQIGEWTLAVQKSSKH